MDGIREISSGRLTIEPLPPNITSVQPGGGFCYRVELAWGRWRRWFLKTFRAGYVRRMAELRVGDTAGAPHEILDPRRPEILPQPGAPAIGRPRPIAFAGAIVFPLPAGGWPSCK